MPQSLGSVQAKLVPSGALSPAVSDSEAAAREAVDSAQCMYEIEWQTADLAAAVPADEEVKFSAAARIVLTNSAGQVLTQVTAASCLPGHTGSRC